MAINKSEEKNRADNSITLFSPTPSTITHLVRNKFAKRDFSRLRTKKEVPGRVTLVLLSLLHGFSYRESSHALLSLLFRISLRNT